jgi:hypothetical protein
MRTGHQRGCAIRTRIRSIVGDGPLTIAALAERNLDAAICDDVDKIF